MHKPSTYLLVIYFPTYLPIYMRPIKFLTEFGYKGETKY
jgi:hypothetical protein